MASAFDGDLAICAVNLSQTVTIAIERFCLARDVAWLDSATKRISQTWAQKNANRKTERLQSPATVD